MNEEQIEELLNLLASIAAATNKIAEHLENMDKEGIQAEVWNEN